MSTIDVEADIKRLKAEEQAKAQPAVDERDDDVIYVYPRWSRLEILAASAFVLAVIVSMIDAYGVLVCR